MARTTTRPTARRATATPRSRTSTRAGFVSVLLINNDSGGFAARIETTTGTTLQEFLDDNNINLDSGLNVRVKPVGGESESQTPDYVLQEGDRVTVAPRNYKGQ